VSKRQNSVSNLTAMNFCCWIVATRSVIVSAVLEVAVVMICFVMLDALDMSSFLPVVLRAVAACSIYDMIYRIDRR